MFSESEFTIIVGAGPTGLTVARQLQRLGAPFRILERSAQPFTGSRGKGLQPRTLEVLDDLGLIDRFRAAGDDYPEMLVHRPDGRTTAWRMDELHDPTDAVPYPNLFMVPQWRTSELLAEGVPVEFGVGVEALEQDSGGVRVALDTGETLTARYVVGADGGRSTVRRALGVEFLGSTHEEERLLIADVRLSGLDRSSWHIWPGEPAFRLGLCPLPGGDWWQLTAPPTDTPIEQLVASVDPTITISEIGWTSQWRANIRMASRFRVGNVFLAGDAAHVHSPAGGQGLNTGIQDGYNLGWKLATGDDTLLDTYEAERLPVTADVLGISTDLHRRHVDNADDAMRRDDPILRQLSLNYRGGPLAAEHRTTPGLVRAGDRAPDASLTGGRRIFDLLRGGHATLLAFGFDGTLPALPPNVRAEQLPPSETSAWSAYDIHEPTLLAIRPDNYVGCATQDPQDITDYLKLIGH
ncbi:FAD-dependent monooxygenase [Actinoplanes oblitus]|uniref:FAD-dependent monooxygenase n=1 Tax=Actinoplanes oblitus TaxID=3040509 RepID=A0ABY8WLY4_9ACTN|nr:FAD-dependent monooxygenase [Actinoplanes oblitus]WIM98103.1 FAD-dependent monooxygenase [Actinoplanes oblitus]